MGTIIYKSGELGINGYKDKESLKEFLDETELIKDGWGGMAFYVTENSIEFAYDEQEGSVDPYEDAVGKPIADILKLAKKYDVQLDGDFVIGSSCSDYDNITIRVRDSKDTYHNTQVLNAPDEDLIAELESRGYKISMDDKSKNTQEEPSEDRELFRLIEAGNINILWRGWYFSGGRDWGNWHEYDMFKDGEKFGDIQLYDDEKTVKVTIGDEMYETEDSVFYKKLDDVLNKALSRDDKEILAACGDEAQNIYLPAGYDDISREDVLKSLSYTADAGYDTVTVTKYGYNDFDIYFHNGDCSVRGTATDILQELTQNKLSEVKSFAEKNFSAEEDQLTVVFEPACVAVSSPWMDSSARFPLDDADAFFTWGVQTVTDFCIKVMHQKSAKV